MTFTMYAMNTPVEFLRSSSSDSGSISSAKSEDTEYDYSEEENLSIDSWLYHLISVKSSRSHSVKRTIIRNIITHIVVTVVRNLAY